MVRVVAAGDIACVPGTVKQPYECRHDETAALVETLSPAHVIPLGDLQYEYGEAANFAAAYAPTWGRFKDKTRPAVGNHEYVGGRADGYYGYFGAGVNPDRGWYSFDVPDVGWHVVILNSVCSVVGCAEGSEQLAWLRADLAEHGDARCVLAAWHHPRFSSGWHGPDESMQPLWQALVDARADVVLSGHDHHYERLAPRDGLRQFIAGTGGRNLYPVIGRAEGSEFVDTSHFGVLEIELREASYTWRFHALDAGVVDEGTTTCA